MEHIASRQKVIIGWALIGLVITVAIIVYLALSGVLKIGAEETKCRLSVVNPTSVAGYSAAKSGTEFSLTVPEGETQEVILHPIEGCAKIDIDEENWSIENTNPRSVSIESVENDVETVSTCMSQDPPCTPPYPETQVIKLTLRGIKADTTSEINVKYNKSPNPTEVHKLNTATLSSTGNISVSPVYQEAVPDDSLLGKAVFTIIQGSGNYTYKEISNKNDLSYSAQFSGNQLIVTPKATTKGGSITLSIVDTQTTKEMNIFIDVAVKDSSTIEELDKTTMNVGDELKNSESQDVWNWCYTTNGRVAGIEKREVVEADSTTTETTNIFSTAAGAANIVCRIPGDKPKYQVRNIKVVSGTLVVENKDELLNYSATENGYYFAVKKGDSAIAKFKPVSLGTTANIYDKLLNQNPQAVGIESAMGIALGDDTDSDGVPDEKGIALVMRGIEGGGTTTVKLKHIDMAEPIYIRVDVLAPDNGLKVTPYIQAIAPGSSDLQEAVYIASGGEGNYQVEVVENTGKINITPTVENDKIYVTSNQTETAGLVTLKVKSGKSERLIYTEIIPTDNALMATKPVLVQNKRQLNVGEKYTNTKDVTWSLCYSTNGAVVGLLDDIIGATPTKGVTRMIGTQAGSVDVVCRYSGEQSQNKVQYLKRQVQVSAAPACEDDEIKFNFTPNAWNLVAMPHTATISISALLGVDKLSLNTWGYRGLNNPYDKTDTFNPNEGLWFSAGLNSPLCFKKDQSYTDKIGEITLPFAGLNLLSNPTSKPVALVDIQIKVGDGEYRSLSAAFSATDEIGGTKKVPVKMLASWDPAGQYNKYDIYINRSFYKEYEDSVGNQVIIHDIIELPKEIQAFSAFWLSTLEGVKVKIKYP